MVGIGFHVVRQCFVDTAIETDDVLPIDLGIRYFEYIFSVLISPQASVAQWQSTGLVNQGS